MCSRIFALAYLPFAIALTSCNPTPDQYRDTPAKSLATNDSDGRTNVSCGNAGDLIGRVEHVRDGDTFHLLSADGQVTVIRLAEIDAPENAQPWSNRSKQALNGLLEGRSLCARPASTDRYGRTVAHVYADGDDVSRAMIAIGAAWAYRRYLMDQNLIAVEQEAKAARRGLWSMPGNETLAPWDYRTQRRNNAADSPTPVPLRSIAPVMPSTGANCSARPRCNQMASCGEALGWLRQCGPAMLDGDHDGVPCENICGHSR